MFLALLDVLQHGPVLCRGLLPTSLHRELYSALVCGTQLPASEEKQAFLDSGLIHIMVVSGAHLLFIEALLARAPAWLRLTVLGLYCWLTGFGAPVVKAFVHRALAIFLKPRHWRPLQIEAMAVALILCIRPSWLLSRSMQMSWMCSLAMNLPRLFSFKEFDQAVKSYLMLFVFTGASLVSIAWNTLLAPFVGMILFPLCLLVIAIPGLVPATDVVWEIFLKILTLGPRSLPFEWYLWTRELFWIPPLTHLLMLRQEVKWRRAYSFS